ncbi:hormogonium polysaccharide secretion pseudopilin HpsB [Scytonema sp. NUACC26]|uniref:hormogonium polysaccharide secretion pseudopilin HpsB n=1 Tax=Scytonema sp. NUACC26 TaxID=3140176 RepID=UPI0034DCA1F5
MINYKKLQTKHSSGESGFTIIESLVALIIAAVLLTVIAPVIVLSTATRLQARRVELATQAAKTYIDGVKTGVITQHPPITTVETDFLANPPTETSLACPTGNAYCTSPSTSLPSSKYLLYCIDGDINNGDPNLEKGCTNNSKDLIIQVFGYNQQTNDSLRGYRLGLRVYRADAFKSGITLKASKENIKQQQTFTGGTGLTDVQAPLLEMTTDLSPETTSFDDLCRRLKPKSAPSNPNPNPNSQC